MTRAVRAELAEKGRTPVLVDYERPHCYVVAPIGPDRGALTTSTALGKEAREPPARLVFERLAL
jgi:hypothetical protein